MTHASIRFRGLMLKGCGPSANACQKAFSRFTSSGVGTLISSSLSVMSPQSTRRKPYQTSTPRGPNGSAPPRADELEVNAADSEEAQRVLQEVRLATDRE